MKCPTEHLAPLGGLPALGHLLVIMRRKSWRGCKPTLLPLGLISLCVCVLCVCTHVYMCVHGVYTYLPEYVSVCIRVYMCMCTCARVCVCVCCARTHICMGMMGFGDEAGAVEER